MGLLHRLWQQIQSQESHDGILVEVDGKYNIVPHFIGGGRYVSEFKETLDVYNPLLGQAERKLYNAGEKEVDAALRSASEAFKEWSRTPVNQRLHCLKLFKELLVVSSQDLCDIVVQEEGVSLAMAKEDLRVAMDILEDSSRWRDLLSGRIKHSFAVTTGEMRFTHQPIGPVVGIENGRLCISSVVWFLAGALSCGNTVIVKPSIHHPSIAIFIADLIDRANFPKGVFNVLQGDDSVVELLYARSDVKGFVHHLDDLLSTREMECIATAGARANLAIVKNSHSVAVVLPDADLEMAASRIIEAFIRGCQNDQALHGVIVVGDVHVDFSRILKEKFEAKFQQAVDKRPEKSSVKPLIPGVFPTEQRYSEAKRLLDELLESDVTVLVDGSRHENEVQGWFMGATLVDFVHEDNPFLSKTLAMPVLPIIRVEDWTRARRIITEDPNVNSVGLFGSSMNGMCDYTASLKHRYVGVNSVIQVPEAATGLAGFNQEEILNFMTMVRMEHSIWDGSSGKGDLD